jgi:hypothetical protein
MVPLAIKNSGSHAEGPIVLSVHKVSGGKE